MDLPIIFSGPMVRALLRGEKTQTRRLLYSPRTVTEKGMPTIKYLRDYPRPRVILPAKQAWALTPWHQRKAGDRLYVRENVRLTSVGPQPGECSIAYEADGDMAAVHRFILPGHKLKRASVTPCIHMPRAISRITLVDTEVRIERLQDITETDARAEGMHRFKMGIAADLYGFDPDGTPGKLIGDTAREAFAHLWDYLHHPGPSSWGYNPHVVVQTFTVVQQNIDQMERDNASAA